jgi:autotransporter-associated beta strand protein
VNLNANLTVGTTNLSTTFGGGINGSGSLTKIGTGTLDLTGNNGYSGATTVNGGTLLVNSVPGRLGHR